MTALPQPLLVLFDIDGTLLLKAATEHAEALHAAIRRVYGVDTVPDGRVEAAGRTDIAIARSILTLAGMPDERISEGVDDLRAAAIDDYAQRAPADLSARIAPGVPELLRALDARDDVRLALVTGNLEPIARLKLMRAGIGQYFPRGQGAFGSDSEDRALLPPLARRRAGGGPAGSHSWPRTRTVVVGDTPRDIACARADGVRCLAIATGPYPASALTDADTVVASASEALPVLEAMAAQ